MFSIFSSGGHFVRQSVNHLGNFGRRPYEERFGENFQFVPVVQEEILFKDCSSLSSGSHFVQRSLGFLMM